MTRMLSLDAVERLHNRRVIIFDSGDVSEVQAIPNDWDSDDINRYIQSQTENWERATVTKIQPVTS